jgi:hypothetical protein
MEPPLTNCRESATLTPTSAAPEGDLSVPHVHLPQLEDDEEPAVAQDTASAVDPAPQADKPRPRSKWFLKIGLEAVLISLGVFLALMGEQWRDSAHIRETTDASLRRFRTEIATNRAAVEAVRNYHIGVLESLKAYLAADPKARQSRLSTVQINGLQPVFFENTAWDLALATQSLAHIDPQVAFALSRIYGLQRGYAESTRGILNALYIRPMIDSFEALSYYYGDVVPCESALLKQYDEVLPQIDRALEGQP